MEQDFKNILRKRQIKRGCIFHSKDIFGINHGKYFVIMGEDESHYIGFFFINSEINEKMMNLRNRQDFIDLQIPIQKKDYNFLKKDYSFVCCNKLNKIQKNELHKQIDNELAEYMGLLKDSDLQIILSSVRKSKIFNKHNKETFFKE